MAIFETSSIIPGSSNKLDDFGIHTIPNSIIKQTIIFNPTF